MDEGGIKRWVRAADYLSVAQIFLQDNFLLERPLTFDDVKPRLLGHWGTCHGINVIYAMLRTIFIEFEFVVGPGHGFPALQASLFLDRKLTEYYPEATVDYGGVEYICKKFSWPYGFPSHASPETPGVVLEGGELGYSLATAYGMALGKPGRNIACLIGDGELETGTALASLNLNKLIDGKHNARVLPVLHLNGYKISGPTIYGRKSDRELLQLLRGFGYEPVIMEPDRDMGKALEVLEMVGREKEIKYFVVMRTEKGAGGPRELNGEKIAGNYLAHQVPLPLAKTDEGQLRMLEEWLAGYKFREAYERIAG